MLKHTINDYLIIAKKCTVCVILCIFQKKENGIDPEGS